MTCAMSGLCLENVSCISSLSSSHWQAHGFVVGARTTSRIETQDTNLGICLVPGGVATWLIVLDYILARYTTLLEATMTFPLV